MSPANNMTGQTGRIRTFIHQSVSPRLTRAYAWMGFANRAKLTQNIKGLGVQSHEALLDLLASKNILKQGFRNKLTSLKNLQEHMLLKTVTMNQIKAVEADLRNIKANEKLGEIFGSLAEANRLIAEAEAFKQGRQPTGIKPEELFNRTTWTMASTLDRIFPNSNGIHSKFLQTISRAYDFTAMPTKSGAYRIGFVAALALGVGAIAASPFLFPFLGAQICTMGFEAAIALKTVGAALTTVGMLARVAKRYQHIDSDKWYGKSFAWLGRQKWIENTVFRAGISMLFLGCTFGTSVGNTFVLGEWLLNHGTALGALTIGLPASAALASAAIYTVGSRNAIRANSENPAPYGEEALRNKDIKWTYFLSGTAFAFSLTYFAYRWIATSLFVAATFAPITAGSVAMTMGAALGGYFAGYMAPHVAKKIESPWFSMLTGTLGSVAAPLAAGALLGDFSCVRDSISAVVSLGVFAQDIHSTTHGAAFHKGQMSALFPDRLVPNISMGKKKLQAGYFGRLAGKIRTSFWEKAHVTPPDVVFSALTSALFEPNAYLKQCIMQADPDNRGVGQRAKNSRAIVKITEQSQEIMNKLYRDCRKVLNRFRSNPQDWANRSEARLAEEYQSLIDLLCHLSQYFGKTMPEKVKEMRDEYSQDWKGIYDATVDISKKKGEEFAEWAHSLETRLRHTDRNRAQLTPEEVKNVLLYLCDRFDKEFILGIRKDSNEYVMRIQKNENQSGTREFIGNSGYEVTRFDAATGQSSIERIIATHIRRQNMEWEHDASNKYTWHHRTSKHLEGDKESVKQYRQKVRSHSKDLDYVINDNQGRPLALQTQDGKILLLAQTIAGPLTLKVADGTEVTVKQTADGFTGSGNGQAYEVNTISNYNRNHNNNIYLVANYELAQAPYLAEGARREGVGIRGEHGTLVAVETNSGEILLAKPLNEPVRITKTDGSPLTIEKTATGYISVDQQGNRTAIELLTDHNQALIDGGRKTEVISVVASPERAGEVIAVSGLPEKMNDYYKQTHTRPLYTYSVDPHDYEFNLDSEFVNGRIAFEYIPIMEADRQNKYASVAYHRKRKVQLDYALSGLPRDAAGKPLLPSNIEMNWSPMHMLVKTKDGQEYVVPYLEEKNGQIEPTNLVEKEPITDWKTVLKQYAPMYVFDKNKCKFEDGMFKAFFKHEYLMGADMYGTRGINEIFLYLPAEAFTIETKDKSGTVKKLQIIPDTPEEFTRMLNEYLAVPENQKAPEIQHKRNYNWRRIVDTEIKDGKIYFVYDTENGTRATKEVPKHQSNADVYSIHLPPVEEIANIETEVFTRSVGTLPYARYSYRFNTIEEAEQAGHARVKRNAKGEIMPDQNQQPVMEKGSPIWIERDPETGQTTGYIFQRFARPESIFQLGSFDPNTVDRKTVRVEKNSKGEHHLAFDAVEWDTKLYPVEAKVMDLGTEDHPKARVKGIISQAKGLKQHFGSGSVVWSNQTNADGSSSYHVVKLGKRVKNATSVIEVNNLGEESGQIKLEVVRKQKHGTFTMTHDAFQDMWHTAEWVDKVELGAMSAAGREVNIYYKNPYTNEALAGSERQQTIVVADKRLAGKGENYRELKMELREIYDRDGNCHLTPHLSTTRVKKSRIKVDATDENRAALSSGHLTILDPRSALRLEMADGKEQILPLNDQVDGEAYIFDATRASPEDAQRYAHHLPHFEDGKVGLVIGPQLSISGRNWFGYAPSGIPYCALDQSIFMAYDLSAGYNYGRQPYSDGVGGGNIQPHKSRSGDGRTREGTTVQNGTPVGRPLRKTLASVDSWNEAESLVPFFSFAPMPATITEDYREGKGIYKKHGHAAVFHNKVVAIGAGVEDMIQILTQRRRWPTSVPIGQYWFFRDLMDEMVYSKFANIPGLRKLTKPRPSHYTWDQLLHEYNGVTWYYTGVAEYARSFAPLAYYMGYTAYPVDPIAFPTIWALSFTSSMASHIYSMKKVGNHWLEAVYWGQAAYKTLVPNFVEMTLPLPGMPKTQGRRVLEELVTSRLAKECLGQFGVTALAGGAKMEERYRRQLGDDITLKAVTALRGLMEMQNTRDLFTLEGGAAPDAFAQATTYFAVVMNTIWPFYDMLLNRAALQLAGNDRRKAPDLANNTRHYLISQMLMDELDYIDKKWFEFWKWSPSQAVKRNKMQYTLGITDAPKGVKAKARYLQELSDTELTDVLSYIPQRSAAMLQEMLDAKHILPAKVATILESMAYLDEKQVNEKVESVFRSKMEQYPKAPLTDIYEAARIDVMGRVVFARGLAIDILMSLSPDKRALVLASMQPDIRRVFSEIIGQN